MLHSAALSVAVFILHYQNPLRGPTRPPTAGILTAPFHCFTVYKKIPKKIPKKICSQTLQLSDLLEILKYKLHNFTVYCMLHSAALSVAVFILHYQNPLRGPTRPPTAGILTAPFHCFTVYKNIPKKIPKKICSQTLQLSDLLEILKYKLHNFTVYSLLHSAALSVAVLTPSLSKPLAGPNPPAYGGNTYSTVSLFHCLQKYS